MKRSSMKRTGLSWTSGHEIFYKTRRALGVKKTRILSAYGGLGNTFMIRLKPGTDLLTGIREVCMEHDIKSAVILCTIGSLQRCIVGYIKPDPESVSKTKYDYINLPGPVEFCSGQGTISETENGKIEIHMHGVLSDRHNRCYCGHIVEGDNEVLANMEIVIAEIENMTMLREMDTEVGAALLNPRRQIAARKCKTRQQIRRRKRK